MVNDTQAIATTGSATPSLTHTVVTATASIVSRSPPSLRYLDLRNDVGEKGAVGIVVAVVVIDGEEIGSGAPASRIQGDISDGSACSSDSRAFRAAALVITSRLHLARAGPRAGSG